MGGGTIALAGRDDDDDGGVGGESGLVGGGRVVMSVIRVTVLKDAKARRGELGDAVEWSAISGLLSWLVGGLEEGGFVGDDW